MPFSKNNKVANQIFINSWLADFPKNSSSLSKKICPNKNIGSLNVNGRQVEVDCLANNPGIFRLKNILSPEECDHIIKISQKRFARSPAESATSKTDKSRTSSSAFLTKGEDEVVKNIEDRISRLLKINIRQIEPLQVVYYKSGQEYKYHTDWFNEKLPQEAKYMTKESGGQREYTLLIYLNDLEKEDLIQKSLPH